MMRKDRQIAASGRLPRLLPPLLVCAVLAATDPSHAAGRDDPTALSLERLLEIRVIGAAKYEQKQSEVAAAVSVITRQDIKTFGWRTLGEALASLPGVYTTYDHQYTYLGMRGFGLPGDLGTRTLVTINGNRVNDPVFDQGPIGLDFPLNVDLIERIEFLPGPAGAVYGQNAMFGVVNVVTRTGKSLDGTELAVAWERNSSRGDGRMSWGRQLENGVELAVSASGMHSRGQELAFDYGASGRSGVASGLDGERDSQLFANVLAGHWSFEFAYGDHRKYDPTGAYLSDPFVPGQYQGDKRTVSQLQYKDQFLDETLQVLARLFAGAERYSSVFTIGGIHFESPAVGQWRGAEVHLVSTAIQGHKITFGAEYQDNVRQDQYTLYPMAPANNISIPNSGYRGGLYVEDEWRLAESLSATIGARLDRDNVTGNKWSPRAALIWQADVGTNVKALFGRAHRSPNAFERNYGDGITQVANLSLQSESIDTTELAADHRIGQDLDVRASVYQWTLRNLVTLGIDPVSGLSQFQSGTPIQARGIELAADKTWHSGARLRGSVSSQEITREDGTQQLNSPRILAKFNLSAPLPWEGTRASGEWAYNSSRLSLDGTSLGGYAVTNLMLSTQHFAKGLDVSLAVYNLLDKRYAQPGSATNWQNAFEQDGRSLRLTMTYAF